MAATAVADSVLSSPFTSSSADRIVAVFARHLATSRERELTSFAIFQDWKARARSFERLSGYTLSTVNLLGEPAPQTIRAAQVTDDFFDTLGTTLALGHGFAESETAPASDVCIISDRLWRSRFGANPSIVGSVIHLDTVNGIGLSGARTIVGVVPRRCVSRSASTSGRRSRFPSACRPIAAVNGLALSVALDATSRWKQLPRRCAR